MTRRRTSPKRTRDIVVSPNGITGEALLRARALEVWARTGKRPATLNGWQLDPATVDTVLAYLAPPALAVQAKALDQALHQEATPQDVATGAMVAKNLLDRRLGRPIERVQTAGHVAIIFSGLDPDALPDAPPVDNTEVVDLPAPGEDE